MIDNPAILQTLKKHILDGLSKAEIMKAMGISSSKFDNLFVTLTQLDNIAYKVSLEPALKLPKINDSGFLFTTAWIKKMKLADDYTVGKFLKPEIINGKLTFTVSAS